MTNLKLKNLMQMVEKNATAIDNRKAEYGTVEQQLEYITENGLTKWQENVTAIKKKYPKE